MATDPNMLLIDISSPSVPASSVTIAEMLVIMKDDEVPGSVKLLLGHAGTRVKTWDDFNRLMQSQVRKSKHKRGFQTSQSVAIQVLKELRESYYANEAKKVGNRSVTSPPRGGLLLTVQ